MVRGFSTAPPNRTLLDYAARLQARCAPFRVLDIGCGAGRNAVPLALSGARVVGTDLSWPMLLARRIVTPRDASNSFTRRCTSCRSATAPLI